MDIRKELTWGIVITLIVALAAGFYVNRYYSKPVVQIQSNGTNYTQTEVAKHNQPSDCWLIINNRVYDVTNYLGMHPGGPDIIAQYCGADATQAFLTKGGRGSHSSRAVQILETLFLGLFGNKLQQ